MNAYRLRGGKLLARLKVGAALSAAVVHGRRFVPVFQSDVLADPQLLKRPDRMKPAVLKAMGLDARRTETTF